MDLGFNSPENTQDSPPSGFFSDNKTTSTSSPKTRRTTQKRVVSVPIKDVDGGRHKGETNPPPSDSWAWRKYGQKPIKGSPYPRGYYRCSSSKGCPARKQVERSRSDPTTVVVTYSSDHNHPSPPSRTTHHHHNPPPNTPTATEPAISDQLEDQPQPEEDFTGSELSPFEPTTDQHRWFSDLDSDSSTILESPLMTEDVDMAMIFSVREDEESFFADLGELPECTTVFGRREVEEHRRRQWNWCGTT